MWTDDLRECISGSVQFGVLDSYHKDAEKPLPVVVAVGINYTQEKHKQVRTDELNGYKAKGTEVSVVREAGCRPAVALALAAYNRNRAAWEKPTAACYPSPSGVGPYAAVNATAKSGLLSADHADMLENFVLIMTNVSPFISEHPWQKQVRVTPGACENLVKEWSSRDYLDDLSSAIGQSVDLWIGHSATDGTKWVWPEFRSFVKRNNIEHWLLTPNLSPIAYPNLDGYFREKENPRFPLFGPEKA